MRRDWLIFLILLAGLTASRLWMAVHWLVTPEEAFLWLCAQRMDLAFFDLPWGAPWLVAWGGAIAGDGSLGIRLFFPVAAAIATLGVWVLALRLSGVAAAWWVVILLNAAPGFQVASVEAGTMMPALAGSLLGLAILSMAPRSVLAWLAGGVAFALALQFSMWALVAVVTAMAWMVPGWRGDRGGSVVGAILTILLALCGLVPFLLWNAAHDWPLGALGTFQTYTTFTIASAKASLFAIAQVFSWPAGLAGFAALVLIVVSWKSKRGIRRLATLAAPALVVWVYGFFSGQSSLLVSFLLFCLLMIGLASAVTSWTRAGVGIVVATGMMIQFYLQTLARPPDFPWPTIRKTVESLIESGEPSQNGKIFLISQSARQTGLLNYHIALSDIAGEAEVFPLESQNLADQFGFWPSYDDFVETEVAPDEFFEELRAKNPYRGRSALYMTREPFAALPQAITAAFEDVQLAATIQFGERGVFYIYFCRSYQTLPL